MAAQLHIGAVSPSGVREKDLNLAMTYMLKSELEKRGAKVVLSRPDDNDVAMSQRLKTLRKCKCRYDGFCTLQRGRKSTQTNGDKHIL